MATRTILLRGGDARDIGLVDALMQTAFDPRFGEAWTRSQCLGVMAMPGVRVTLAMVDDEPAGFAMTRSVADEAELLLLGVAPQFRRRGVGTALLRSVEADCIAGGIATLHLEVRASNEAVRLYTGNGFAKVGERRAYYRSKTGQAHDAHTYSRTLPR
ncbi:MAG: GNAT family N-acetyltransferase [Sphingomonas sp.]|jgi:ribosomal-protein-alanine N-acetyltransferase|nr:MAG: GNAT family N-acetyltransferase [Sphingomonas sp.]